MTFEDVVESVKHALLKQTEPTAEEFAMFPSADYKGLLISPENFHEIPSKLESEGRKIAFVDGGNGEIISAPSISLQFIRLYFNVFRNNKKMASSKHEFFVLVTSEHKGNGIFFNAKIISEKTETEPILKREYFFDSLNSKLSDASQRVRISKIGEVIRRLGEIRLAEYAVDKVKDGAIILDGSLKSVVPEEQELLNEWFKKCKNSVIAASLSKTCNLFTNRGRSFIEAIRQISPKTKTAWYYSNVADIESPNHLAKLYFVRLHKRSKHIFMFEHCNKQNIDDELFYLLSRNASDPAFIGYPYGLVEADMNARVSNAEKEYLRIRLFSKIGKHIRNLENVLSESDAHSLLDKMSY